MASSEQINELATALSLAQADMKAVGKDSTNPFFKSKYAGLPEVVKTASPIISAHGLSVTQTMGFNGEVDTLTTWLLHKSGQFINDTMRLHLSKEDAQGHGSATTYARRYSYMAILGLVAEEDDDGEKAKLPSKPMYPKKPYVAPYNPNEFQPEPVKDVRSDDKATGDQIKTLVALVDRKGISTPTDKATLLNKFAKSNYGAEKITEITQAQASELVFTLETMDSAALLKLMENENE